MRSRSLNLLVLAHRYPRLVRALCWSACLSYSEAACVLRDWRCRDTFDAGPGSGGEAVAHAGGTAAVLRFAVRQDARAASRLCFGGPNGYDHLDYPEAANA